MKLLPINSDPFIKPYTHNMFMDSIVNNGATAGNKQAQVKIVNKKENQDWKFKTKEATYTLENDVFTVYMDPYKNGENVKVFRKCNNEDEIIVNVEYLQYSSPNTGFYVFIRDSYDDEADSVYLFGKNLCYKPFAIRNEIDKKNSLHQQRIYDKNNLYWYKLQYSNNEVNMFVSIDGAAWNLMDVYKIKIENLENINIGFIVSIKDNQYYNWLFSNHIQLHMEKPFPYMLDYFVYPIKNWKRFTLCPLIDFVVEKKNDVKLSWMEHMGLYKNMYR